MLQWRQQSNDISIFATLPTTSRWCSDNLISYLFLLDTNIKLSIISLSEKNDGKSFVSLRKTKNFFSAGQKCYGEQHCGRIKLICNKNLLRACHYWSWLFVFIVKTSSVNAFWLCSSSHTIPHAKLENNAICTQTSRKFIAWMKFFLKLFIKLPEIPSSTRCFTKFTQSLMTIIISHKYLIKLKNLVWGNI